MSKIIKNAQLEFKDDSGNYIGVDSIAERKTSEQLAEITSRGQSVKSTLPPAYNELVDSVAHTFDLTKNYSAGAAAAHILGRSS